MAFAQSIPEAPIPPVPFDHEWLIEEAARLASEAYGGLTGDLPGGLSEISYNQYRDIRYKEDARIWADDPAPFKLDLFHPGFMFKDPVKVAIVDSGSATEIPFSAALFDYGPSIEPPTSGEGLDFSGFRARYPINTPDYWDEFLVFQGASYFRAIGRSQRYGLSARGLAINTAEPEGEEFPVFREFWIERPAANASALVAHALLDSVSITGAYRFEVMPGAETIIEVSATLFTRQDIAKIGVAPLTSMFMFNAMNRAGFDDFRRAVHDSDGLQMLTGSGEWIWRPLANPAALQISMFGDTAPRGFGLMQRAREHADFEDMEAGYERRPSLWIEPLGDWGRGFVELVEIPTDLEINDNIVAYWRPGGTVPTGGPWKLSYRMRWTDAVQPPAALLSVKSSHAGLSFDRERRLFVIDFAADGTAAPSQEEPLELHVSASVGDIVNAVLHRESNGVIRASFELDPGSAELSELRLRLTAGEEAASETWLYRWTAQ